MLLVGYLTIGITSELGVKVLASFQRITLEPWSIGMVSLTITARAMLPNGPGVKSAGSLASIKPNIACGLGQT